MAAKEAEEFLSQLALEAEKGGDAVVLNAAWVSEVRQQERKLRKERKAAEAAAAAAAAGAPPEPTPVA